MPLPLHRRGRYSSGETLPLNGCKSISGFQGASRFRGQAHIRTVRISTMKTIIVSTVAAIFLGAISPAFAAEPGDKVKISIEKWRKPGTNNIGTADITVTNDNDFAVKDIRVKCDYMSKTGGRKIETDQRLALTVKAKTTKLFRKTKFPFIDTEAAEGSCKITGAAQS
jgi:Zn-dependent alcohol dehydrogenase